LGVREIALAGLFAALTVVGGLIRLPLPPVPFTLQTFFVVLSGLLLGAKLGSLAQALYVVIGLVGVPVFAGGGGPGYVLNPSFGYLLGFVVGAYVTGRLAEGRLRGGAGRVDAMAPALGIRDFRRSFVAAMAGILCCYAVGVPYLYVILNYVAGLASPAAGLLVRGALVFLPWDVAKAGAAAWLAVRIGKGVRAALP
jgi:biotin transport system substrate-specific component